MSSSVGRFFITSPIQATEEIPGLGSKSGLGAGQALGRSVTFPTTGREAMQLPPFSQVLTAPGLLELLRHSRHLRSADHRTHNCGGFLEPQPTLESRILHPAPMQEATVSTGLRKSACRQTAFRCLSCGEPRTTALNATRTWEGSRERYRAAPRAGRGREHPRTGPPARRGPTKPRPHPTRHLPEGRALAAQSSPWGRPPSSKRRPSAWPRDATWLRCHFARAAPGCCTWPRRSHCPRPIG